MEQSESIAKIAAALVAVQGEIENPHKTSENPHFRSKYADLAEIVNVSRPVLAKHGLAVVQSPGFMDGGATLETLIVHNSGEWIKGVAGAPLSKADPQGVGSAITYLRRYSLAAFLGLAQEDDDGNAASGPREAREERPRQQSAPAPAPAGDGGFSLDSHVGFGKYKERTWREVWDTDPDYVTWVVGNMERLRTDVRDGLNELLLAGVA